MRWLFCRAGLKGFILRRQFSGSEMLPENAWADVPMGHIWKSQLFLLGQKHQLILRDILFVLLCKFLAPDGLEGGKTPRFPAHKTFVLIKQ